jgi:hypothetical protein
MTERPPLIRVPEGWTYAEKSEYSHGRWETVYEITHTACGTPYSKLYRPSGDDFRDAGLARDGCVQGLAFFIGNHPQNCEPKV